MVEVHAKSTFTRLAPYCGNPQFCKMVCGEPEYPALGMIPHKHKKTRIHAVIAEWLELPFYVTSPEGDESTRL